MPKAENQSHSLFQNSNQQYLTYRTNMQLFNLSFILAAVSLASAWPIKIEFFQETMCRDSMVSAKHLAVCLVLIVVPKGTASWDSVKFGERVSSIVPAPQVGRKPSFRVHGIDVSA